MVLSALSVADQYMLPELQLWSQYWLAGMLSSTCVLEVLAVAWELEAEYLATACCLYILYSPGTVMDSPAFRSSKCSPFHFLKALLHYLDNTAK